MVNIISNIPTFVWVLFVVLLIGGLKARKTSLVPLPVLLLFPAAFFSWSLYVILNNYALFLILPWVLCLTIGIFVGFRHMKGIELRFQKPGTKVEIPGSWLPLFLSMTIFTSKFFIGLMNGIFPHLNGSLLLFCFELIAITGLGVMGGRGMNCLMRYSIQ